MNKLWDDYSSAPISANEWAGELRSDHVHEE